MSGSAAFPDIDIYRQISRREALQLLSAVRYEDGRQLNVRTLRRLCATCALPPGLRFFNFAQLTLLYAAVRAVKEGATYAQVQTQLGIQTNDHNSQHTQQRSRQQSQQSAWEQAFGGTYGIGY